LGSPGTLHVAANPCFSDSLLAFTIHIIPAFLKLVKRSDNPITVMSQDKLSGR